MPHQLDELFLQKKIASQLKVRPCWIHE